MLSQVQRSGLLYFLKESWNTRLEAGRRAGARGKVTAETEKVFLNFSWPTLICADVAERRRRCFAKMDVQIGRESFRWKICARLWWAALWAGTRARRCTGGLFLLKYEGNGKFINSLTFFLMFLNGLRLTKLLLKNINNGKWKLRCFFNWKK